MSKRVMASIGAVMSLAIIVMFVAISPNIISGQVKAVSKSNKRCAVTNTR